MEIARMKSFKHIRAALLAAAILLTSLFSADAASSVRPSWEQVSYSAASAVQTVTPLQHEDYSVYPVDQNSSETTTYLFLSFIFAMTVIIMTKWRFDSLKLKNRELKTAKDELERVKTIFTAFAEATSDIIIFCSPDHCNVSFISRAYSKLTGCDTDIFEKDPLSFRDIVHPDDLHLFQPDSILLKEDVQSEKFRVINRQTGINHWVIMKSYSFSCISGEKNEIAAVVISDITELVQSQEDKSINDSLLAQKAKYASMGEMIHAISHQWKQPLNALYLCNQLMEDETEQAEAGALSDYIKTSKELIEHMTSTMQDFRHFFKNDKEAAYFDASETVLSTMRIIDPQMKDLKIRYSVSCSCDENGFESTNNSCGKSHPCRFGVKGLANEFRHAVINILQNAKDELMKADIKEKKINVTMECTSSFTLCIEDNGGGISEEAIEDIFTQSFSLKPEGTGLGLHLTRQIVEKMNGRVWAENSGGGAKFYIDLPTQETVLN